MQPLSSLGNYCHVRMAECSTPWLSLTLCMPTPAVCVFTAYRVSCQAWTLLEESRVSDHANLQEHEHSIYKAIAGKSCHSLHSAYEQPGLSTKLLALVHA